MPCITPLEYQDKLRKFGIDADGFGKLNEAGLKEITRHFILKKNACEFLARKYDKRLLQLWDQRIKLNESLKNMEHEC